ncbi:hypothetical protein BDL97_01G032000 [Sphagnum fallax]|nr:hypothetical protein BDL97_01G032000 [Sphagnum fallax]
MITMGRMLELLLVALLLETLALTATAVSVDSSGQAQRGAFILFWEHWHATVSFLCAAAGDVSTTCIRSQTTPVSSFPKSTHLPFNEYAWLTTHNSFAIEGEPSATGSILKTNMNQEDSVTDQLNNGVRGFMLDFYDFLDDVWLCHSEGGICYNHTAFQPASQTLKEIELFLVANPTEIIIIFIEDYVQVPNGVSEVFTNAGLKQFWFPVSKMPKTGGDWPTVDEMIQTNQRLLVFTSVESKEESEGIAYEWNYMVENMWGDGGMQPGSCPNRGESRPMNDANKSLVLQNYFRDDPNENLSCVDNSANLENMLDVCYKASGNRWTNFLAVDFYKRSSGGGAFKAVDLLNDKMQCGYDGIDACQARLNLMGLPYSQLVTELNTCA